MKVAIIFLLIISAVNTARPQLNQEWVRTYNGPGNFSDAAVSLAVDALQNVYVGGSSYGSGSLFDYAIIKYSPSGSQLWAARFNGSGNNDDIASAMTIDNQGNVYITGITFTAASSYDYGTVKYNSSGVQQWASFYNGTGGGIDNAQAITTDNLGNVYVTGYSYGGSPTSYDYATVKYNSSGVQQWAVRFNGSGNGSDEPKSIAVDASQNVYVTGKTIGTGGSADFATVKYNSAGIQQWVQIYNGPGNEIDIAHSVKVDGSDNVIVTGYSRGTNTNYDYATVKYNSAGIQQWVTRYNGPLSANDIPTSMILDNSANIYITGVADNTGQPGLQSNYATIKYNSAGVSQWTAIYNGPANSNDSATSISLDDSGDVFVTGKSIGIGTSFDFATVQYSSSGAQRFVSRYNGSNNLSDVANCIKVDLLGNTYIAGYTSTPGSSDDYLTVKYGKMTGVNNITASVPKEFALKQNFPNPFNPVTKISYDLGAADFVSLKIFNALGKEVAELVNERQNAGSYEVEFNASDFSSGIYYYKLKTENYTGTMKMILLK